ncbi:hypothetical protein Mia14_0323 [Candidatus Mancarchaeum acidiphilum]|uniref:DUF4932 domain-containing protein n=1 Tax=Candidatus Mancarchaeum acidiphilum TaxID=1920749 RepID=A0A218NMF1_9ARCH|nr:DUF4932 domain-containing protein [Candidatus Mancarchaeum acidiphilum]ASI13650.1 hypothetical protein Mia14_0323 [Candidatus Mancarchaeum acidiphilum]
MKITIDPRIELLMSIELQNDLTNPGFAGLTKVETTYKKQFIDYFSSYKNSESTKHYLKICNGSCSMDFSAATIFHLSNPPDLKVVRPFDRYGRQYQSFIKILRDFAVETDFMAFFVKYKGMFQKVTESARKELKSKDIVLPIESYYGMGLNSYNIILSPLFREGGNGFRINSIKNWYDGYAIVGPTKVKNGLPYFDSRLVGTLWHEFGHHFVEPITEQHTAALRRKFSKVKLSLWGYPIWQNVINEYIIRAISNRIEFRVKGEENTVLKWIREEEKGGFVHMRELYDYLKIYEDNRDIYPTLIEFYPEIIKELERLLLNK